MIWRNILQDSEILKCHLQQLIFLKILLKPISGHFSNFQSVLSNTENRLPLNATTTILFL